MHDNNDITTYTYRLERMIFKPTQVTVVVETSVSQTLTALELRSLLAQLETAVWGQMMASHMVLQETVVNALVSIIMQLE